MENTGSFHQKNGELPGDVEHRKDFESNRSTDTSDVAAKAEKVSALASEKPCVQPVQIDDLDSSRDEDVKPRIILTLRTSETDPEAYFSTSSIREKNGSKKRDLPAKTRNSIISPVECLTSTVDVGKRTRDLPAKTRNSYSECFISPAECSIDDSIVEVGKRTLSVSSPGELTTIENACKRNLRRISNSKESVLQNAIALKEKSFGIPESSFYKKNKSPKRSADRTTMKQPARVKSPKMNSTHIADKPTFQGTCSSNYVEENMESDRLNNSYGKSEHPIVNSASAAANGNGIYVGNSLSKESHSKPTRKRKRYYKGLSYSFNPRRHQGKKKRLHDRNRGTKYQNYDSSEQDTDSQNTIILSEEMNDQRDSKSTDVSSESSQSTAVLFKSATKIKQNFNTSLDVLNDSFNEKAPSPSTGDSPEKPARPESTMITSGGGTAAMCLCQIQERVYMKVDTDTKYHCQAIDSIEGKQIGCCNPVLVMPEGDIKLQRPSVKVTYLMFCDVHAHRLLIHNCCPTCGLFCTQGKFVVCESQHIYHRQCELLSEDKRICPHCGQPSPENDTAFSIGQDKNPIFVPLQTPIREIPCAKMSIQKNLNVMKYPPSRSPSPPAKPSRSYTLPCGKVITSEGLPTDFNKNKLDSFLSGDLPSINNNATQKCTYRTMYHAAKTGDIEKMLACLGSGLNPNHLYREVTMGAALHVASANGYLSIVHILRQAGAQLDVLDKEQNTSLMLAATNGKNEVLKYLIKAGANTTFKGKDGMTALHLSAKAGNLEGCYYLLSHVRSPRQYVNIIDDGGWTSLVWAAEHNHLDIVLFLLSQGADPLVRDSEQNVALHWSAYSGSVDISEALLHFNADIDCTNVHGDTPLHICARQEHYPCVILLLAQGARTDIRNAAGMLALDCCVNKPCDSYNAIKLNIQLKDLTARGREKTVKILTNDITRGHELNPVQCVNAVDDEPMPTDFVYITENCFTSNIKVDRTITSLKSCTCTDSCNAISCTCGKLSLRCWYTDDGKLSNDFNYAEPPMIFECNSLCSCNKITCNNRVVQHGITARFQLFRTKEKGWGVITLRTIPKGSYVCEYIGEIISDTEADTREDDSYLFDLDNKDGETYCIDAFRYGNIARFINHSCIPNLQPVKVFVNHQDLHFPRIAFFANRDIEPNEELGFDYGEKFWIIKYKSFTCTCGAESCRYSEKTIQKTLDVYNKKLQMEE